MRYLFLLTLLLAGCERPIPPDDQYLYSTINQKPDGSFIKIGVKIEYYKQEQADRREQREEYVKTVDHLRSRLDRCQTELVEAKERIRELEKKN